MSVSEDLSKLTTRDILIVFLGFVGTAAPGALVIWRFAPDLLATIDMAKLLFLSFAITAPLVFFNAAFVRQQLKTAPPEGVDKFIHDLLSGCISNIRTFTIPLLISFFWTGMSVRWFVFAVILSDVWLDRVLVVLQPAFRVLRLVPPADPSKTRKPPAQ